MGGTAIGGERAAKTNKERHGTDFYKVIGQKGGKKGSKDGVIKGFAAMSFEKRSEAGRKGGTKSKRTK